MGEHAPLQEMRSVDERLHAVRSAVEGLLQENPSLKKETVLREAFGKSGIGENDYEIRGSHRSELLAYIEGVKKARWTEIKKRRKSNRDLAEDARYNPHSPEKARRDDGIENK